MLCERDAIQRAASLIDSTFDRAVEIVAECTGNVIVSGVGKSGLIGQKISATLSSTGTPSHFMHATEALHGDLGRLRAGDVALLLSYSGTTEEVITLAAVLRQDEVPIISISGDSDSQLGRLSDAALSNGEVQEACPHNLAPTASTAAMLALGDALALTVSRARAFSPQDFHRRHPNGALGRKMLPVTQILRFEVGRNLAVVPTGMTVKEVLEAADGSKKQKGDGNVLYEAPAGPFRQEVPAPLLTANGSRPLFDRRCGAVLIVDATGRLAGIFTDSDLRRLLTTRGPAVLDEPVESVMTHKPLHVLHTDLVKDALQIVRQHRVDEVPVVDDNGRPVGIIDVQDLVALKLIAS